MLHINNILSIESQAAFCAVAYCQTWPHLVKQTESVPASQATGRFTGRSVGEYHHHHAVSIWLAETPCNSMARTLNIGQQRLGYSARARRLVSSCGTRALILLNMVVCIHPFSQTNIMIWLHFSSFTQLKGEHLEYCARMYVYGKDLQWSADDCQDFRTRKRTTALMANVSFTNKGMLCKLFAIFFIFKIVSSNQFFIEG